MRYARHCSLTAKGQQGASMLEALIATGVILFGVVILLPMVREFANVGRATRTGQVLADIGMAAQRYCDTNVNALNSGQAVAGVAQPMSPTQAELMNLHFGLSLNTPLRSEYGFPFQIRFRSDGSSKISGLVYLDGQIYADNQPSQAYAFRIADSAGRWAVIADPANPAVLTNGYNDVRTNPLGKAAVVGFVLSCTGIVS